MKTIIIINEEKAVTIEALNLKSLRHAIIQYYRYKDNSKEIKEALIQIHSHYFKANEEQLIINV